VKKAAPAAFFNPAGLPERAAKYAGKLTLEIAD
jgi:hypothetical protein